MVRDYRQATLDKLLAEIDSINRNNWSWFTDFLGDRWLKLGKVLRLVSLEDDLSNLESYQRKVLDMNNTTKEELRQIFERVYEVDSTYSRHFDDLLQRQQYYNAKISKLTEMINPHFSIAPAATISEAVSGFNSEISALSQNIVGEQLPNTQNDMLNPLGMIATGAVYSIFNKLFQADSDGKLNNVDSYPFPFDWSDDSLPTWVKEWGKAVDKKVYKDTQKTTLLKVIDALREKDYGKVYETTAKAIYKAYGKSKGFTGDKKYLLTYIWNASKYTTEAYVEYWNDPSLTNLLNCFWESTVGGILRTGAEEAYDVVAKIPFISDWYDKYGVENGNDMVNVAYNIMKKKNVDSFLTEGQALVDKNLFLQAEKVAQSMNADFPNKYEGYHLRFLILMKKAKRKQSKESGKNETTVQFKVVRLYLDEIPDIFSFTPQFLCDNMEWYSAQGKEKEFLALTESDDRYMQVIPNEVLKLKYRYLYEQHDAGYVEVLKDLIQ